MNLITVLVRSAYLYCYLLNFVITLKTEVDYLYNMYTRESSNHRQPHSYVYVVHCTCILTCAPLYREITHMHST